MTLPNKVAEDTELKCNPNTNACYLRCIFAYKVCNVNVIYRRRLFGLVWFGFRVSGKPSWPLTPYTKMRMPLIF